jgi:hypothetical protein
MYKYIYIYIYIQFAEERSAMGFAYVYYSTESCRNQLLSFAGPIRREGETRIEKIQTRKEEAGSPGGHRESTLHTHTTPPDVGIKSFPANPIDEK